MNLFFLRHAKAEPRSPKYKSERKRPLSAEGEQIMKRAAQGMVEMDLDFDLIITSPYLRAAQSARIVAKIYETDKIWTSQNLVAEGGSEKVVDDILDNYSSLENILLVGHEPGLSNLMSLLLTGGPELEIELKKSGLAKLCIEQLRSGKCARLEWILTPRQLQRMK